MKPFADVKALARSILVLVVVLVWCLFMGVTAVSLGVGSFYPPVNLVAKPFVCANGKMIYEQTTSHPSVGSTITNTHWYCVDNRSEVKTPLDDSPMGLYAGVIQGLGIFGVVVIAWLFVRRGRVVTQTQAQPSGPRRETAASDPVRESGRTTHSAPAQANAVARMKRLEELRAANMISEAEYQQKRADILKDV
jgi:hypothetical protein